MSNDEPQTPLMLALTRITELENEVERAHATMAAFAKPCTAGAPATAPPVGDDDKPSMRQIRGACAERGWEVVHEFTVVYIGWELDNAAAIARRDDGTLAVVSTSHTGLRVDEMRLKDLVKHRDETRAWAAGLETAVKLVEGGS